MTELIEVDVLELVSVGTLCDRLVVAVDDLRGRSVARSHDIAEFAGVEIHATRLYFSSFKFDWLAQFDQCQIVSELQSSFIVAWMIIDLFGLVESTGG